MEQEEKEHPIMFGDAPEESSLPSEESSLPSEDPFDGLSPLDFVRNELMAEDRKNQAEELDMDLESETPVELPEAQPGRRSCGIFCCSAFNCRAKEEMQVIMPGNYDSPIPVPVAP